MAGPATAVATAGAVVRGRALIVPRSDPLAPALLPPPLLGCAATGAADVAMSTSREGTADCTGAVEGEASTVGAAGGRGTPGSAANFKLPVPHGALAGLGPPAALPGVAAASGWTNGFTGAVPSSALRLTPRKVDSSVRCCIVADKQLEVGNRQAPRAPVAVMGDEDFSDPDRTCRLIAVAAADNLS